jgi:2-amino-4-hydroxy-6-hydroxymethyldihydropteridine diphosphokinase
MQAFLMLGSNIGDRDRYLKEAVEAIANLEGSEVRRVSSVYETEPWGKKDQGMFLNQVVEVETELEPRELLTACQKIEKTLGRKREEHWGPRTVDIDILLYGESVIDEETIKVPHPHLSGRRFVLVPLAEVVPEVSIPGLGETVSNVLKGCPDRGNVKFYKRMG